MQAGKLDGVKVALSRGEMEQLSCGEKLKCVNAALQTKLNGALMETLMERLDLDQIQSNPGAFLSFHSNCVKRALASGSCSNVSGKLFRPGELIPESLSGEEQWQKMTDTMRLTSDCANNTKTLVQHHLGMKEAVKAFDSKKRMMEEDQNQNQKLFLRNIS